MGRQGVPLQVDIGFGDTIHPGREEAEYPTLLDHAAPRVWANPRETSIAEKFEAMVRLGASNSRMKDFWDVAALSQEFEFDGETLRTAIDETFRRRGTPIGGAAPEALRLADDIDANFFVYLLEGMERFVLSLIEEAGHGTKRLRSDLWRGITVWLPELPEQRTIAQFLDRETGKIDGLVAKKEELIELLQEKRTALITHAVTKGLDPNAPMKDSGIEWLGEIPAHWEVSRLSRLTPPTRKIMYGIVLPGPHVDDGVPIVKGGDVSPGRLALERLNRTTREIESGYKRSRLLGGDLVFAIRGSIGDVEIVPDELEGANVTQDAARISPIAEVNHEWLLFALRAGPTFAQLESGALGATIRGINIRDLKRAMLPVPPRDEQDRIAEHLIEESSKFDLLLESVEAGVDHLQELRTALISAAVTGKIDVREESP